MKYSMYLKLPVDFKEAGMKEFLDKRELVLIKETNNKFSFPQINDRLISNSGKTAVVIDRTLFGSSDPFIEITCGDLTVGELAEEFDTEVD